MSIIHWDLEHKPQQYLSGKLLRMHGILWKLRMKKQELDEIGRKNSFGSDSRNMESQH
jgi:hypothetical protein